MQALRPKLWAPLVLVLGGAGAFAASQGAPVEAADHNDPPNRVHSTAFGMPRAATDDAAADIADIFAWTNGSNTILAMSFDGPNPAGAHALTCDRDVIYQLHLTSDGGICPTMQDGETCSTPDATHPCGTVSSGDCVAAFSDVHTITFRFAHNGTATDDTNCVVEAEFASAAGVAPIAAAPVGGLIGTNITSGSVQLHAGLHDDAFFFDLQGFHDTATSGTLSFRGLMAGMTPRDSFAGLNTPVVVVEFPTSAITTTLPAHALGAPTTVRVWGSTARYQPHT
jgi:hypothetical protein